MIRDGRDAGEPGLLDLGAANLLDGHLRRSRSNGEVGRHGWYEFAPSRNVLHFDRSLAAAEFPRIGDSGSCTGREL